MRGILVANSQQLFNTLSSNVPTMGIILGTLIMDFMSAIMENIFKKLIKCYDGFCFMVDFLYELFMLVKLSAVMHCTTRM